MNNLVSIIMPSYNTAKYISAAIESILNQTYENWELIIVDDCSTDNTDEILTEYAKKDSRIRYYKNEKNSGAAVARNRALRQAKGKWVAFLDSDDLWEKDKLEKQICFMKKNNYHFSYTNYIEIDENSNPNGKLVTGPKKILSKHKELFLNIGTLPLISDYSIVELCYDKYKMYKFLSHNNIKTITSYIDKDLFYKDLDEGKISFPVFVKPINGSASININKAYSKDDIELLFSRNDNMMIQEYMNGVEYGADVYVDLLSEEVVSIFIKEKIKMRAGETDKAKSIKDEKLFAKIIHLVNRIGFKGVLDIDIFKVNEEYYISEINPRFGGGYPHAYECGQNIPRMILNNIYGKINEIEIGLYQDNVYMMKFNEVKILTKPN